MKAAVATLFAFIFTANIGFAEALEPKVMLTGVADKLTTYLDANKQEVTEKPSLAQDLVRRELLPYIDDVALGRRVLAKHWRQADETQREAFTENFINLVIDTYARGLSQYDGQTFTFEDTEYNKKGTTARVKSQMQQKQGAPVRIDYLLKKPKGLDEWRVVDVSIEGISMVGSYRNQFGLQIEKEGLDSVIKKLENNEIEISIAN